MIRFQQRLLKYSSRRLGSAKTILDHQNTSNLKIGNYDNQIEQQSSLLQKILLRRFSDQPEWLKNKILTKEEKRQKMIEKAKIFAKLGRYQNQTGTLLLFYPCMFGVLLGAPSPLSFPLSKEKVIFVFNFSFLVAGSSALFLFGAFNLRSAGCAVNDSFDKKLDQKVERTRDRPLAAGKLTQSEALAFTGAHLLGGLFVLTK